MSDLSLLWKLRKALLWYTSHVILKNPSSSTSRMSPKKKNPFHTSSLFDTMIDKVIGKALHCKSLNIGGLWYNMAITFLFNRQVASFHGQCTRRMRGVENSSCRSTLVTTNGLKDSCTMRVNSVFPKCFSLKSLNSVTKNICHKNAFQYHAHCLLQWPSRRGGCLLRGVSAQGRGRLPRVGGGYPGCVSARGMSVPHVRDRILKLNPIHVSEIYRSPRIRWISIPLKENSIDSFGACVISDQLRLKPILEQLSFWHGLLRNLSNLITVILLPTSHHWRT